MRLLKFGLANYRAYPAREVIDATAPDLGLHWVSYSNDIVLIAGENNSGKTSLLTAYRDFRASKRQLAAADFHQLNTDTPVVMELVFQAETDEEISDEQTGKWFSDADRTARVRKVWPAPNQPYNKYSFDPEAQAWIDGGFGGFDTILQNRLPEPIHIKPDMTAEDLKGELQKLFKEVITRHISQSERVREINDLLALLSTEIEGDEFIKQVGERVSDVARDVFPGLSVRFENPVSDKGVLPLLEKQTEISVQIAESPELSVDRHGHGSQRVFVLSVLSALAEELASLSRKGKTAPENTGGKIIQIEEPELFLSPISVRKMKQLLYSLAAQDKLQVVACTHSPVMIDFSRPKQTVALVERTDAGSRIFQSDSGSWGRDRVETLRLMYRWNPALSEAIFANRIILVEGETEFACLTRLLELRSEDRAELEVHIIDCKGKGELQHFQRLLREMGRKYMVVHDSDVPFDPANSATSNEWNKNEAIWAEIELARSEGVAAIGFAFTPDFEQCHGYTASKKRKMLDAMNFIDNANRDGKLEDLPISDLYTHIKSWESAPQDIEALRTNCAP